MDPEGRFLIAKLTIEEKYFFITNIYGPNNCHDQDNFIKTLNQQLMSKTDRHIKSPESHHVRLLEHKSNDKHGRNTLVDLIMEEINLTDVYREMHPKSKSFTYVSKSFTLKSRNWLLSYLALTFL